MKKILIIMIFSFLGLSLLYAHGPKGHEKKHEMSNQDSTADTAKTLVPKITKEDVKVILKKDNRHEEAGFDDFPTLHPMVVHFPIVLLLVAVFVQIGSLFLYKKELSFVTLILLLFGFIGAYIASTFVHPHTMDLDEVQANVLLEHESYANFTVWLSGIALVLKGLSHFVLNRKLIPEIAVALVLIGSAYCVSVSAHHGSQLVHIEGVGPQGKFLEMHHEH